MKTINESLDQLKAWLTTHLTAALNNLRPPATDEAIAAAEAHFPFELPEDIKTLYRLHDGEEDNWPPGIFDNGHWFLPLSQAIEQAKIMQEFVDDGGDVEESWADSIEEGIISVYGPVKPFTFSQQWLPLTSSNGDVLRYLDFDPAPGGAVGQVIEVDAECCSHKVVASSMAEYLSNYVDDLANGRYIIEDECINDTFEDDVESWGVPDYLKGKSADLITAEDFSEPLTEKEMDSNEEFALTGEVVFLMGAATQIEFVLEVKEGERYTFLADNKKTKGYGAISINSGAIVHAIKHGKHTEMTKWAGAEPPEFFVTHFEYRKLESDDDDEENVIDDFDYDTFDSDDELANMAMEIVNAVQQGHAPSHDYGPANVKDFDDVDLDFYAKTEAELNKLGFVLIGDIEDKTVTETSAIHTFIRTMYHPETSTVAAFYDVPFFVGPIREFESYTRDGDVLMTTTAPAEMNITVFPKIASVHKKASTVSESLYKTHLNRLTSEPAFADVKNRLKVTSVKAVIAAQNEMNRHKHDHLKSIGWVTLEYLEAQAGDEELAKRLFDFMAQSKDK